METPTRRSEENHPLELLPRHIFSGSGASMLTNAFVFLVGCVEAKIHRLCASQAPKPLGPKHIPVEAIRGWKTRRSVAIAVSKKSNYDTQIEIEKSYHGAQIEPVEGVKGNGTIGYGIWRFRKYQFVDDLRVI